MIAFLGENLNEEVYEISKMQKELDDVIKERFTHLKNKNNIVWKLNALVVEMGECLQEWRGFKVWSQNQTVKVEEMKEEFADWFHFVVSVGLEFGYKFNEDTLRPIHYYNYYMKDAETREEKLDAINEAILDWNTSLFRRLNKYERGRYGMSNSDYMVILEMFIAIGCMLGFTWDEIYEAYKVKNKENLRRQNNQY